jgi:hypothetical protein
MKPNPNNDFPEKDRKTARREKLKNKCNKPSYEKEDFSPKDINSRIKKQKEELDNEEWENWDRYYNH